MVRKQRFKIDFHTPIALRTRSSHLKKKSEEKGLKKKMDAIDNTACFVEMNEILSSECCVCLDNVDEKKDIRMKCCAQIMHKACFLEWTSNKAVNINKCLVCTSEFHSVLEYTSFEDILKYAEKKASVISHGVTETLQILGYALTQAVQCKNINIYIKEKSDNENDNRESRSRSDTDNDSARRTHIAKFEILRSRLLSFVISIIIIFLLLISIFSQNPNCTSN